MANSGPTPAQRAALASFSLIFGKQMRARYGSKVYEVYDAVGDGEGLTPFPIAERTFDALRRGGWVEDAEPVHDMPRWRISEAGRDALRKSAQIPYH
jgi:hypothetical protein